MDAENGSSYEPMPRWGHVSVTLQGKVYMWGGRTEDFSESQQKKLASSVEVFDCHSETWMTKTTRGTPPKGLYNSAYALQGCILYVYGGWDGQKAHNSLYQLNLTTFEWAEVKAENPGKAPTEISGCGLVACGSRKLVLFGGYGVIKEKKEKKKKAKVDERYSLATVEDAKEEAKSNEQEERPPVENGTEEQKATGNDTEQKATNNKNDEEKEKVGEVEEDETKVNDSEIKTGEIRDNETEQNVIDKKTEGESCLSNDGVAENGLVASVMAEIEEREKEGEEEERKRADSTGESDKGEKKDEECTEKGEEREKEAESEGAKEEEKDGESESGKDDSEKGDKEGEAKKSAVKEIDVVNEHVSVKSQKAVVVKLPTVSFKLPDDSETPEEGESTKTATGESESSGGEVTRENAAAESSSTEPQPAEVEQTTNAEEEEEEKEDIEECNTTISIYKRNEDDQKGWTNEVKVFDLDSRMWSSQPTSGSLPPPSVDFSFTSPNKKKAVVFGGYQPPTGITNDTFLLDMETWVWTKLSGDTDVSSPSQRTPSLLSHPSARDGHSACVIEGAPRPLIMVTGGWDATDQATNDMWLLDINSGLWKQIMGGKDMGCRFWHTTVVSQFSSRMRQLLTFGGCPGAPESNTTGSWPKMADTVIVEMGKMPSLQGQFSGDSEDRWIVVDAVTKKNLGDPMRRLRETALLTSFRAQRAESLIKTMIKKMSAMSVATPQRKVKSSMRVPTPEEVNQVMEKKEEEEVKRPFWQKATDEIQMTYEEIGRGRFSVVKVAIFHETRVAARCLFTRIQSEEDQKVFTECLELAAQLRHPNLVSFIGAILDREPVIITELMSCNLRSMLEKSALTYYQLVDVAEGVSKALQYLHSIKPHPVIHGEITSTGVLLEGDHGPRLKAKLSDYMTAKYFHHLMTSMTPAPSVEDVFTHSREHPSQEYKSRIIRRSSSRSRSGSPLDADRRPGVFRKVSAASGSPAGGAPDAADFSTKRDVYLFGILLVEMATRTAVLEVSLQYLIESISWSGVAGLVKKCLTHDLEARPDMTEVFSHVMQLASSKP